MKNIKLVLCSFLLLALSGCEDNENDLRFFENAAAPTELELLLSATQDNSGLVTLTPNAVGATSFDINFGDGTEPVTFDVGQSVEHVYEEGTYTVLAIATAVNGLTTELEQNLVVSFTAPQNLVVTIENDAAVSKQVNVTANADFAINYEVFFGEPGNDEPLTANIGETVSYVYEEAGLYTITVVAMGSAIETTTFVEEDFEVTEILEPLVSAAVPPARNPNDVISVFSDAYTDIEGTDFFPDWGQSTMFTPFDLNGDAMLQYTNLNYQGIVIGETIDASGMETLHIDIWTPNDIDAKISPISPGPNETAFDLELTAEEWTSFDIPLSFFTDANPLVDLSQIIQLKLEGVPEGGTIFVDNIYFYRPPTGPAPMAGTWRMSAEEGFLVGNSADGAVFFACNSGDGCSDLRACYFDDLYVFGTDGSFANVLQDETWIEPWQGGSDACGTPVAPHDGSATASYTYNTEQSQLTLNGVGAYIGLPKVINGAEISNPADAPESITYDVVLTDDNNRMVVEINIGGTIYWRYVLERVSEPSPVEGTWVMSQDEGFFVGNSADGAVFFACNSSDGCSTLRACYFDDLYVFNSNGSFENVLGAESWIEPWQGGSDSCGTPVAPHDGSGTATYSYDGGLGTVTLDGVGAYIGLPKVINGAEIADPADAPPSITYNVELTDDNTRMVVDINIGGTIFWQYVLVKI